MHELTTGRWLPENALKVSLLWFSVALLLWILYLAQSVVTDILLACVLATALYPPAHWLQGKHWPKRLSILLFYLFFLLVAAGAIFLIVNVAMEQGKELLNSLPGYLDRASNFLNGLPFLAGEGDRLAATVGDNLRAIGEQASEVVSSAVGYIKTVLGSVVDTLIVLFLTYFLITDTDYFRRSLLRLLPPEKREQTNNLVSQLAQRVGGYVRGQLLVMTFIGITTGITLNLIGVPYAWVLAITSFFLEVIPIMGPIIAAVLGVTISLATVPEQAAWVLLAYFLIQQVENYVLVPKILGDATGLHPVWVFLAVLTGGTLLGVKGVLLSVPLAIFIQLLLREISQEKNPAAA